MRSAIIIFFISSIIALQTKNITGPDWNYYCYGDCNINSNVQTEPGLVLMGGGPDVDSAFIWMIEKAKGGDFVVIRTDDDALYNPYIYALGPLNSVISLCLFNRSASYDKFIISVVQEAEAIWMAGGNQWTYYSYWKDTPLGNILNSLINKKGIPIGGTSAGMESSGQFINTAEFDTTNDLTSKEALRNPYNQLVSIGDDFLFIQWMQNVLTDAHFKQRDRMGRLLTFMARILEDIYSDISYGIACDEGTALLIEPDGSLSITSWASNNSAYIMRANEFPKICEPEIPLAISNISVFKLSGNITNSFNLSNWSWIGNKGIDYTLDVVNGTIVSSQENGDIY